MGFGFPHFGAVARATWLVFALGLSLAFMQQAAHAEPGASPWSENDHVAVRLVSATTAAGDKAEVTAGLEFHIQPGWKIYWRSPGDAGLPPVPDWHASANVGEARMDWPVPERFSIFGMETFGYQKEVVFPLTVVPERPGEDVRLAGSVSYLACEEICVPYTADLSLQLPAGDAVPTRFGHRIDRYRAKVPTRVTMADDGMPPGAGLAIENFAISPNEDGAALTLEIRSDIPLSAPDVIIEGPAGTQFTKPMVEIRDGGLRAALHIAATQSDAATLRGANLTLTVFDGERAFEVASASGDALEAAAKRTASSGTRLQPDGAYPAEQTSLIFILAVALLGGLILNLMPCVLPVLSLKLISVVSKGGKGRAHIRGGFLAAATGIVTSFLVLAAGVVSLKEAGVAVGWGVQFQQPMFLALMVALLTLFACNLFGLFEFQLPGFLNDKVATAGAGNGLFGDFLTGAFATLLATPCSAPFLGTAVGFALSRGTPEIVAVFAALGVGLALPYLAVAAMPGIARALPRPGPWMRWLKWTMALALVGTGFWLLTVLAAQVGTENAAAIGFMSLVAALVLATRKVDGSRMGRIAWPLSALLAVTTVLLPLSFGPVPDERRMQSAATGAPAEDAVRWEEFDETAIADHVAAGRAVLVDVTADWCVTCQWNKRAVIDATPVRDWLNAANVVAMRADWTRPDPAIGDYLARYGRYGIPFNIIYGPASPSGIPLPELLSDNAVMSAAAQATGDPALASR